MYFFLLTKVGTYSLTGGGEWWLVVKKTRCENNPLPFPPHSPFLLTGGRTDYEIFRRKIKVE